MYVHLGGGCLIKAAEIIGDFSAKEGKEFYKNLKNTKGEPLKAENLSEDGVIDSIVLTKEKIYLSTISALTLQKRINQNLIYHNGGNNG